MISSIRTVSLLTLPTLLAVFYFLRGAHELPLIAKTALDTVQVPTNLSSTAFTGIDEGLMGLAGSQDKTVEDIEPPRGFYTRTLVVPYTSADNVSWALALQPDTVVALYAVDDPLGTLHPPRNKGNEVMVYLTYIIDHYENLPDVAIFMHSHQQAWHNNELLGFDSAEMVRRLKSETVNRQGYLNMRCAPDPGCPEWLHPYAEGDLLGKQEQAWLARCWKELFPLDVMPESLSQPCCAQFALSKPRMLSIPLDRFIFYRDWLLRTTLTDYISGRIWEFAWHYVFTGSDTYCPSEQACYCDGFGVCFRGEAGHRDFWRLHQEKKELELELGELLVKEGKDKEPWGAVGGDKAFELGRDVFLKDRIRALVEEMEAKRREALEGGTASEDRDEAELH
ncbi:MAG: hypothetical protein Q9187_000253 [Circinaria calcarea]